MNSKLFLELENTIEQLQTALLKTDLLEDVIEKQALNYDTVPYAVGVTLLRGVIIETIKNLSFIYELDSQDDQEEGDK
jgi:hypothetical protein